MVDAELNMSALADKAKVSRQTVSNLLSGEYVGKKATWNKMLKPLGYQIELEPSLKKIENCEKLVEEPEDS